MTAFSYYAHVVDYKKQAQVNKYTLTNTPGFYPSYFTQIEGTRATIMPIKGSGEIATIKIDEIPCHSSCLTCGIDASKNGCTACSPPLVVKADGTCDCPDGSFYNVALCSICNSNCLTCRDSSSNCTGCFGDSVVDAGGSGKCLLAT